MDREPIKFQDVNINRENPKVQLIDMKLEMFVTIMDFYTYHFIIH